MNRQQIRDKLVIDGKPPRETIQMLKSNGFRWSPTNGAWQRQLTRMHATRPSAYLTI